MPPAVRNWNMRDVVDGEIPDSSGRRQLRSRGGGRAGKLGRVDEHDRRAGVDTQPPARVSIEADVGEDQVRAQRVGDGMPGIPIVGNP